VDDKVTARQPLRWPNDEHRHKEKLMKSRTSLESTIKAKRQAGELTAEGIKAYRDLSVGRDDNPNVLLAAGKLAMLTPGGLSEARELLSEALVRDSGLHEARAFLALAELQSGLAEAGLETAASLAFSTPDFTFKTRLGLPTSAQTVLGDALFVNKRGREAISAYERAIKVEPHDQHALRRLASLYLTNGRASEAVGLLGRIEETDDTRTLVAAVRLAANDPARLPSISGVETILYELQVI
jgi:tetratricopeptide (TPR) repeat protein